MTPAQLKYLAESDDVVETPQVLAVLRGNQTHLQLTIKGLSGRKALRKCREILAKWFEIHPVLIAPVKHVNEKAITIVKALGFVEYASTDTHVWLAQEKEQFYGK